jgi:LPXTG-motif cell wall-anchored protein
MSAKSLRMVLVAVVVMTALVVAVVPSFAQSGTAGGAMTGMNNWRTLQPGQSVEYRLNFLGSGTGSATIMVAGNPTSAIRFDVYTDQQWMTASSSTTTITPVGRGTVQNITGGTGANSTGLFNSDLIWVTNDRASGLYHIQVTNTSQQAAQFWIDTTGAGNGGLSPYPGVSLATTGTTATTATTNTTATTGTTAKTGTTATTSTTAQGPRTLPVTGGSSNLVVVLMGAGLALIAAGWLATRRKVTQR